MSKSYAFLIALLVILAVCIGAFALYRSTNKAALTQITNVPLTKSKPTSTPSPTPTISEQQQVSAKNTLPLIISAPTDGASVTSPTLTVTGTTAPSVDVSVNEKDLKSDANGKFTATINLDEGQNFLLVVSSSEDGAAEWQGTVTYTPSQ